MDKIVDVFRPQIESILNYASSYVSKEDLIVLSSFSLMFILVGAVAYLFTKIHIFENKK